MKQRTLFSAKWNGKTWEGGQEQVPNDIPKRNVGDCIRYKHGWIEVLGIIIDILRMNYIPGLCKLDHYETFFVVQPVSNPHEHWVKESEIVSS